MYEIRAAHAIADIDNDQCVVVEALNRKTDAIKRAKCLLTDEFRIAAELTSALGASRVYHNGECVAEYVRIVMCKDITR